MMRTSSSGSEIKLGVESSERGQRVSEGGFFFVFHRSPVESWLHHWRYARSERHEGAHGLMGYSLFDDMSEKTNLVYHHHIHRTSAGIGSRPRVGCNWPTVAPLPGGVNWAFFRYGENGSRT